MLATLSLPIHGIGFVRAGVGGQAHDLLELASVSAHVELRDRVAVTRVDQVFRNPLDRSVEGIYEFTLPPGAFVTDLALWVDARRILSYVVGRDTARRFYDQIVSRRVDPALLELVDESRFRLSIFPFPPGGSRRVELEYTQALPADQGTVHYHFPLAPESELGPPIGTFTMHVEARGQHPFSLAVEPLPGLSTQTTVVDEHSAELSLAGERVRAEGDITVSLTPLAEELRPTVMSAPPRGTDEFGHFALWLPPVPEVAAAEPGPRAVSFVIDISSSMGDGRLTAVKRALRAGLEDLPEDDLFNIVLFSDRTESFSGDLVPADAANKRAAMAFVDVQGALGATNFEAALRKALRQETPPGAIHHVVFLTDGTPTLGESDPIRLSGMVDEWAVHGTRLFTVGIGDQVDAGFLRGLAEDQRGTASFPVDDGDIEAALGALFREFARAVFLDLSLMYEGVAVHDLLPRRADLLRPGQAFFQVGRYAMGGPLTVTVTRRVQDRELSLSHPLELSAAESEEEPEPAEAPLLVDEDFADGVAPEWRMLPRSEGRWSVDAEKGYLQVTELDGPSTAFLIPPLQTPDYTIEARMRFGSWEGKVVYSHANQVPTWRLDLMASHGVARLKTQIDLVSVPHPLESNRWYTVRVEVIDGMISTYIDGTQCHHMVPFGPEAPDGQIGVGSYGPTHATQFDYVRVFEGAAGSGSRAPVSLDPVARLWAARKVQGLESQIARYGTRQELLDAVLRLGLDYRLVTRMTSLFAPEEGVVIDPTGQEGSGLPTTAVEEDARDAADAEAGLPAPPELRQNSPNPFNAATAITFWIPPGMEMESLRLSIYNLAGQKVRSWHLAGVAGERRLVWDGRGQRGQQVASGVYIYRLEGRDVALSRRMLLVR